MPKEETKSKPDESVEDLQAELTRLQRQFRLLEDDRRAYKEETEYQLRKQRETIHNLNLEHDELAKEDKLAGSVKNQNLDAENTDKLRALLDEEDFAKTAVSEETEKLEAVNSDIKSLLDKTDLLRKNMGGCKESERRCKSMMKLNAVMGNRLNEANIKFNVALAENNEMRQEINHINIQRKRFEDLLKKLSKMFKTGKEEKDFLIESSTSLFNSRDEAHHRMQSLRERSERDMTQFNSELKDLLRVIDHDKKLREFMNTKMEERNEMYEAAVQGRKEKKLLDHIKILQVEVEHYENIFKQLTEVSGIEDVDEMVNKFIKVEDENFASFNFIKEQSQEIQEKEATIEMFKQEIEAIGKEEVIVEKNHKHILKELQQIEKEQIIDHQRVVTQLKNDQKMLDKVCTAIDTMFQRTQCNRSIMAELLGGSHITHQTLLSYLGLIEQRSSELIQAKTLLTVRNRAEGIAEESEQSNVFSIATVGKIGRYLVAPPSVLSDMSDIPTTPMIDIVCPLSQKEVRKVVENLTKAEPENKIAFPVKNI